MLHLTAPRPEKIQYSFRTHSELIRLYHHKDVEKHGKHLCNAWTSEYRRTFVVLADCALWNWHVTHLSKIISHQKMVTEARQMLAYGNFHARLLIMQHETSKSFYSVFNTAINGIKCWMQDFCHYLYHLPFINVLVMNMCSHLHNPQQLIGLSFVQHWHSYPGGKVQVDDVDLCLVLADKAGPAARLHLPHIDPEVVINLHRITCRTWCWERKQEQTVKQCQQSLTH